MDLHMRGSQYWKIVCNCGNEMRFEMDKIMLETDDEFNNKDINASQDYSSGISVVGEHDEVWISCNKCKQVIHFFT